MLCAQQHAEFEERCHEQPHRSETCRLGGQQRDNIETAFRYCLCDRSRGRNDRLGVGIRLGHPQAGKLGTSLAQILRYSAADHDPECKVHLQRD